MYLKFQNYKLFTTSSEDYFFWEKNSFFYLHPETFFVVVVASREEGREKHPCVREVLSGCLPEAPGPGIRGVQTGGGTHYLDMRPDQEPNRQTFGYDTTLQPTEPQELGLGKNLLIGIFC